MVGGDGWWLVVGDGWSVVGGGGGGAAAAAVVGDGAVLVLLGRASNSPEAPLLRVRPDTGLAPDLTFRGKALSRPYSRPYFSG